MAERQPLNYARPRRRSERMPRWVEYLEIAILVAVPAAIAIRWLLGRLW